MLSGRPDCECQTLQNSTQKPKDSVSRFIGKTGGLGHLIDLFCSTHIIVKKHCL